MYPRLKWISPDYEKDCLDCPQISNYASVWNMISLSNLLNVKVVSVYPSVNGTKDYAFVLLNTEFRPPFVDPAKEVITIMWTNTSAPQKNGFVKMRKLQWFPNHFVPLVNADITEMQVEDFPFLSPVSDRSRFSDQMSNRSNELEYADNVVGKGGLSASPGVVHADCMSPECENKTESDITEKEYMISTPANKLNSQDGNTVGKGGLTASPGVVHTDCIARDENTAESDITDIAFVPELSTIAEQTEHSLITSGKGYTVP
jgi:hypothetical protein